MAYFKNLKERLFPKETEYNNTYQHILKIIINSGLETNKYKARILAEELTDLEILCKEQVR